MEPTTVIAAAGLGLALFGQWGYIAYKFGKQEQKLNSLKEMFKETTRTQDESRKERYADHMKLHDAEARRRGS